MHCPRIPAPDSVLPVSMADGTLIHVRRYEAPGRPRLVVSHGNGLATDAYAPFWVPLIGDYEVIAFDVRNHGWNEVGDFERHSMPVFVWDFERICEALATECGEKPLFGAFHSLTSLVAIQHVLRVPERWRALALFEPPFSPPNGHPMEAGFLSAVRALANRTRERQFRFETEQQYFDLLRRVPRFDAIGDEGLAHFVRATLSETANGFELHCPREFEAKVYETNLDSTIGLAMPRFPIPGRIIGGDPSRSGAEGPSLICRELSTRWQFGYEAIPNASHFLQLEQPGVCREAMKRFFANA
ncbi:MAG: alpha/beta hydrolase [Pseudomonadota bacterium]